ncbi:C1q-like domain-containing protein [Paenibacillus sp. MMO-177]|uniref:C1q-like domain-containing protein n=1 Tax=Paenibacillus sp. MMO-177 TaxID=3081289 RepID=UPI00301A142B
MTIRKVKKGICRPRPFKSAFKAVSNKNQSIGRPEFGVTVKYGKVIFDAGNEYNPDTSTFIPKHDGVYSLFGSILYKRGSLKPDEVLLLLTVNDFVVFAGSKVINSDREFITAAAVKKLRKGDKVKLVASSHVSGGVILKGCSTRFKGKRIR